MQIVFGLSAIVILLEIISTGYGANNSNQNRGYVIDIPSWWEGNEQWSKNRQKPHTKYAVQRRPNYLGYTNKPSTSKQESGRIHLNTSLLVPSWYLHKHSHNYFTKLETQDLTKPLPPVYYHPQKMGYEIYQGPKYHTETHKNPPVSGHYVPSPNQQRPLLANHLLSSDVYPSPIHRQSSYHHRPSQPVVAPPPPPPHQQPKLALPLPPNVESAPPLSPRHLRLAPHTRIAPPPQQPRLDAAFPQVLPSSAIVASPPPPPPPGAKVASSQHIGIAPSPQHLEIAQPLLPPYHGKVPKSSSPTTQIMPSEQNKPVYSVDYSSSASDGRKLPYVKKNKYDIGGKTTNNIYQSMPTFFKTIGYFRKDRTKRSIHHDEDHFHEWEFDEDHLNDWEFEEEEYEDAENGDKEEGHVMPDSTEDHRRKKRWASSDNEDESGEEEDYNADPWNYDDNDSGESSQTETWNSGSNNADYTWNNDDDSDDYTWNNDDNNNNGEGSQTDIWNNDDNNDNGESSQADTWNNDDNNDEYSWNNDDENNDDETQNNDYTNSNDHTDEGSYHPAAPKPRPPQLLPEHNRQIADSRRPRPPPRRKPEHGPLSRHRRPGPKPQTHRPLNRPQPVHDRRPNSHPTGSQPPHRRPNPLHEPNPSNSGYNYQLPIPPAPPRHPKSPSYPSEHLQYDWDYEECE